MPSIGKTLRQARLDQRLTLTEVAERTRVSGRYLEAIEADNPAALPGAFFYRSFLRSYAEAVGLDAESLLSHVDPAIAAPDQDVLPVLSANYVPAGRIPQRPRYRVLLALAGLLGTLVAGSFLYGWWDRTHRKDPTLEAAPAESVRGTAPKPTPAEPSTVPKGTVKLAAREQTWVSVSANGKTLFSGVLEPAETKQFDGLDHARLVTGNAAALGVEWNGRDLGPIGPRGQVRLVLLNGQDARIVTPDGS